MSVKMNSGVIAVPKGSVVYGQGGGGAGSGTPGGMGGGGVINVTVAPPPGGSSGFKFRPGDVVQSKSGLHGHVTRLDSKVHAASGHLRHYYFFQPSGLFQEMEFNKDAFEREFDLAVTSVGGFPLNPPRHNAGRVPTPQYKVGDELIEHSSGKKWRVASCLGNTVYGFEYELETVDLPKFHDFKYEYDVAAYYKEVVVTPWPVTKHNQPSQSQPVAVTNAAYRVGTQFTGKDCKTYELVSITTHYDRTGTSIEWNEIHLRQSGGSGLFPIFSVTDFTFFNDYMVQLNANTSVSSSGFSMPPRDGVEITEYFGNAVNEELGKKFITCTHSFRKSSSVVGKSEWCSKCDERR